LEKGIGQIKRILPAIIYLSLGASVVLFLLAGPLIQGFYGKNFTAAVAVFRILTIVPVLSFINSTLGLQTMVNLKMDKAYFSIIFSGGVFSVIFNIIVIKFYGYLGCAWSWIIAEAVIAIVQNLYLKSKGYNLFQMKNFSPKMVVLEFKTIIANFRKPEVN
ncbi:MAG: polysaccharide biosynthesis C-terminal domain-containing protein, partial [Bacteroidetes bacterium]|nr:polysaccharide biosynthesis C-terminal domain-containing protein [Bacteroidota bacterium]